MGRHAAGDFPEVDRLVDDACAAVGAEIEALKIPRLAGVVLGGGYGRGEGGVLEECEECKIENVKCKIVEGGASNVGCRLSNDLDFFAVTEPGAPEAETIAAIAAALEPLSKKWTQKLGVDVDFAVKTPWRLKHDESRVMVQELLRGYCDVAGEKGEAMFAGLRRVDAAELPWSEAVRLLMNRGMGLLLAKCKIENVECKIGEVGEESGSSVAECRTPSAKCKIENVECKIGEAGEESGSSVAECRTPSAKCKIENVECKIGEAGEESGSSVRDFINRNINKCVLGAGDARLIAKGAYRWKATERAAALGDKLYAAAVEWKFMPKSEPVCDWETAREVWLAAEAEVARSSGRTLRNALRWLVRRRTLGSFSTFGLEPEVRVLRNVSAAIRGRCGVSPSLRRDWEVFN